MPTLQRSYVGTMSTFRDDFESLLLFNAGVVMANGWAPATEDFIFSDPRVRPVSVLRRSEQR